MPNLLETISNWITPGSYSFDNVVMIVDGITSKMPSSSDYPYRVKRNTDQYSSKVGADGTVHMSKGTDKSGVLEVDVMANSPINSYFESCVAAEDAGLSKDVFFMIKDTKRMDIVQGSGKVLKPADNQFGKTENERTWSLLIREIHSITGTGKGFI